MKIIMVDASVGNDYSVCLCNSLTKKGMDVTLVAPQNKEITVPHHFKVLKLSPSKEANRSRIGKLFSYMNYFRRLFRLTAGKNKIVHYQFFRRRDEIVFYLFLKLTGRKLYHTAHNVLPHNARKYDFLLQKIVYKSSCGIIAHSNFIRNKIITDFNINPRKLRIIPHGNFDFYKPQEQLTKEEARRDFGIRNDDKVLLFFGGIREYKGLDTLLEAFRILKDDDKFKLLIAGAPQDKQSTLKYEQLIQQITSNGKILYNFSFIPDNEVARYFIASDVLILPYKNIYHSGLVHLAYSFGKPIIAARVGDFEEVIEQDRSGILLDENTADDLACKIRMFFSNENRQQMEQYVLNLNTEKYSWENISEETINYYETSC
jgi:glycosyltransferase involved in cell wall biosynthesis